MVFIHADQSEHHQRGRSAVGTPLEAVPLSEHKYRGRSVVGTLIQRPFRCRNTFRGRSVVGTPPGAVPLSEHLQRPFRCPPFRQTTCLTAIIGYLLSILYRPLSNGNLKDIHVKICLSPGTGSLGYKVNKHTKLGGRWMDTISTSPLCSVKNHSHNKMNFCVKSLIVFFLFVSIQQKVFMSIYVSNLLSVYQH